MKKLSLALLPFMVAMTSAQAESAFDPQGQYLLGDWDGKRTELAQQGIKFEANILTDTAYLAEGGRNEGADPLTSAQLWLGTQLDMEKTGRLGWCDCSCSSYRTSRPKYFSA